MIHNRTVPVDGVLPHLYYRDADEALDWLCRAFGFVECFRAREDDGRVHIAQLRLGAAYVMIRYTRPQQRQLSPADMGGETQTIMVVVEDVDAHHAHAAAEGAQISEPPTDRAYGERDYSVVDLDGHVWTFTQHVSDVDPATFADVP